MCDLLGLHYFLFRPSVEWHCPDKGLFPCSPLGSYSCHCSSFPWAYWPIGLITSFLGLPQPTCLIITSYSSYGSVGCYSCHVGPLVLLLLFLGFLGPLASSLPLILPMGLVAIIPVMSAHWTCYLFSWASSAHLFHLYLLFFPWASSCYSCYVGPLYLLPVFLGFLSPLTSSLPLILPMGLLVAIPAMLAHWVY